MSWPVCFRVADNTPPSQQSPAAAFWSVSCGCSRTRMKVSCRNGSQTCQCCSSIACWICFTFAYPVLNTRYCCVVKNLLKFLLGLAEECYTPILYTTPERHFLLSPKYFLYSESQGSALLCANSSLFSMFTFQPCRCLCLISLFTQFLLLATHLGTAAGKGDSSWPFCLLWTRREF